MARPQTKEELLLLSQGNMDKLLTYIDALPEAEQLTEFPEGTLNRNIRDVLGHLHHWHLMMAQWYEVGMDGQKPEMPAPGFTWKTVPELNRQIRETYSEIPLSEVRELVKESHLVLRQLIHQHSEEELFEKKYYGWTGSTSLAAYLISATSSHYDWALKLIKRVRR